MHMCLVFLLYQSSCLMLALSFILILFLTAMFPFFNVLFICGSQHERKNWISLSESVKCDWYLDL
jgi:hypothetical protein